MKNIVNTLVLLIMLISCEVYNYRLFDLNTPVLTTQDEVLEWVAENIVYDTYREKNWQAPEETLNRRAGDCEDFVILAMYFLDLINVSSRLIVVNIGDKEHAILKIDNKYYEAQHGIEVRYHFTIKYSLSYENVIAIVYTRNIE